MNAKSAVLAVCLAAAVTAAPKLTLEQALSYSFPTSLTGCRSQPKVAWVLDEKGARNVWFAAAPGYTPRRLTPYVADDGQEIDQLAWTPDGQYVLYTRGGDFETHRDNPNPSALPGGVDQSIWMVRVAGEPPRKIAEGNSPAVSPKGDRIVFLRSNQLWTVPLAGGDEKPAQLLHEKGSLREPHWSPDGTRVLFTNNRGDHTIVGLYDLTAKSIRYLDPSVDHDESAIWSPDGKEVAFVRIASTTRAFLFGPVRTAETPWSIRLADAQTGKGRELWHAGKGPGSAFHPIVSDSQLLWGAGNRIVFPWEKTGYVHLYSVSTRGDNPTALNTDGNFEVEHVNLSNDGRSVLFSSNQDDIDRRHLWSVSITGEGLKRLTTGDGIEWSPVPLGSGGDFAMLRSDARTPAHAAVKTGAGPVRDLSDESEYPSSRLVTPQPVMLSAADGMPIHAQLFLPSDLKPGQRRPAMIFFHGGSRRQMLLGFHYMNYYHNAYAMNEYLASLGYIVLSVNYRSGIGYGLNFREALNYGATGASEFNDVLGAGLYLRNRADVDGKRIGLWGGSYGGYLTALGLARASDLFAAGVDFHGVHEWNNVIRNFVSAYDPNKDLTAARIAFESSPMASVATWRSPVLLIHGDDDRNVPFHETVVLVEALRKQGVPFEQLIFPDEIHGFLTHKRWLQAYEASADFLNRYLKNPAQ